MAAVSLSASLFSVTTHNSGPVSSPDNVFSDHVIASPKTHSAHRQIAPFLFEACPRVISPLDVYLKSEGECNICFPVKRSLTILMPLVLASFSRPWYLAEVSSRHPNTLSHQDRHKQPSVAIAAKHANFQTGCLFLFFSMSCTQRPWGMLIKQLLYIVVLLTHLMSVGRLIYLSI